MSTTDGAVTLHMYIRRGTPSAAAGSAISMIAEMYEFGVIGPGSQVWVNVEVPGAFWILSDRSSFVRVVDVPTAGWVRLSGYSAAWGNVSDGITKTPGLMFSSGDMPIERQSHDLITVAFRNADRNRMRAIFGGKHHEMDDFEITHRSMRAVDFKIQSNQHKEPLSPPSDFDIHHAAVRGLDLMAVTEGPAAARVIRDNPGAFTTTILADDFERIRAVQQRMAQVAEGVADPIIHRIAGLDDLGPFKADEDDEDADGDFGVS